MTYDEVVKAAGYELHWFAGADSIWINSQNEALSVHVTDGEWAFYDWQKNDSTFVANGVSPETLSTYLAS